MTSVDRILGEAKRKMMPPAGKELTTPYRAYAMTSHQRRIYKDPEKALAWATKHGMRFPEAEPYIMTDLAPAFFYARNVIKGRWPEAEATIAKDPRSVYWYAINVIQGRWPEAEATIAKDPHWAYFYARDVIQGRWPEGEKAIAHSEYKDRYLEAFPEAKDDWAINGLIDWLDT